MRTFYLRFRVYAIKIIAFQRNASSNLPMQLVLVISEFVIFKPFLGPHSYSRSLSGQAAA
jgi:hypothetical protein